MNEHRSLESWRESPRGAADPRDDSSTQDPQMPSFPRSVDEDYSETIVSRSRSPLRFFRQCLEYCGFGFSVPSRAHIVR